MAHPILSLIHIFMCLNYKTKKDEVVNVKIGLSYTSIENAKVNLESEALSLIHILREQFGIPVFINNDGNLFAYGEALAGTLPEVNKRCLLYTSRCV